MRVIVVRKKGHRQLGNGEIGSDDELRHCRTVLSTQLLSVPEAQA